MEIMIESIGKLVNEHGFYIRECIIDIDARDGNTGGTFLFSVCGENFGIGCSVEECIPLRGKIVLGFGIDAGFDIVKECDGFGSE